MVYCVNFRMRQTEVGRLVNSPLLLLLRLHLLGYPMSTTGWERKQSKRCKILTFMTNNYYSIIRKKAYFLNNNFVRGPTKHHGKKKAHINTNIFLGYYKMEI